MNSIDISVVTATYNERENISLLVKELNRIFDENNIKGEVIVVDDSSPDGTSDIVLELKKTYPRTVLNKRAGKLGVSSAYRDGIKLARGEVIALMDADFSQPPAILPQLYTITAENKIGWGSRYVKKVKFDSDIPHLIGTKLLNKWISLWLRTNINDHTLGYFAIKRKHLDEIVAYAKSKGINPFDKILYGLPVAAVAKKLGIGIVEVEAPYEKRKFGKSKIGFFDGIRIVSKDMLYTVLLFFKLK